MGKAALHKLCFDFPAWILERQTDTGNWYGICLNYVNHDFFRKIENISGLNLKNIANCQSGMTNGHIHRWSCRIKIRFSKSLYT